MQNYLFKSKLIYLGVCSYKSSQLHLSWSTLSSYPGGIIDLHLCQQFAINAEVAEAPSLIVDNAVALAGHRDEPWAQIVVWPLQSP